MTLHMDGKEWSINQMGPDFLMLEASEAYPPGEGMVHLTVNGRMWEIPVELPKGINPKERDTPIKSLRKTPKDPDK